jgi:starvation-inducible outer membrane lipoprotein
METIMKSIALKCFFTAFVLATFLTACASDPKTAQKQDNDQAGAYSGAQ